MKYMKDSTPLCHICHIPSHFLMRKDGFDEHICPKCDLSFVFPQPEAEWLKDNVYSLESGYQGNKKADLALEAIPQRYKKALEFLKSKKQSGSLLDVGCSNGQFMYWARENGFECKGIEINKRTAVIAVQNGFEVFTGFLEEAPYTRKSFDVVYLGDVIEHVNDPRRLIMTANSFLKENGMLVFSTPNMDCFWSRSTLLLYKLFVIPWSSLTPPHHLFQFNFDNLGLLLGEIHLKSTFSIFDSPARLAYNLGSLHVYKHFKQNKTLGRFLFMCFSYGVYTLLYGINVMLKPFLDKDFQMIVFYEKRSI